MKKIIQQIIIAAGLMLLSVLIYYIQIVSFHDDRNTFFYLFQDLAFIPIQVLLITFILNRALNLRQKKEMLKKMNMVIGAFFSYVGIELIAKLSAFHIDHDSFKNRLLINAQWGEQEFKNASRTITGYKFMMRYDRTSLDELKTFIVSKREFLLTLLENANLLEHESFTDMLWAVFHVVDEFCCRESLTGLPANDYTHLEGDLTRAYSLLINEWIAYILHLKSDYPYLYSLAVRKNPFNSEAKVIID